MLQVDNAELFDKVGILLLQSLIFGHPKANLLNENLNTVVNVLLKCLKHFDLLANSSLYKDDLVVELAEVKLNLPSLIRHL